MDQLFPLKIELSITNELGEVLLVKPNDKRKKFTFPFHVVEQGETIAGAALRATTSFIKCDGFELVAHHMFLVNQLDLWPWFHIVFAVHPTSAVVSPHLPDGFRDFRWIPLRLLADDSDIDIRVRRNFGQPGWTISDDIYELMGPKYGGSTPKLGTRLKAAHPSIVVHSDHLEPGGGKNFGASFAKSRDSLTST